MKSTMALWFALLIPQLGFASDPRSPLEISDSGQGFQFQVLLRVPGSTVLAGGIYNRIAGAMVDVGASSVQNIPVSRSLTLQADGLGKTFIDVNPFAPGQPPLPNGVYSQWLELRYTPGPSDRSAAPLRQRRAFFFRVVNGSAQRLSLAQYSTLVDPATARTNKSGQPEQVHLGTVAPRLQSLPFSDAVLVESGAAYSTQDTSELGQ